MLEKLLSVDDDTLSIGLLVANLGAGIILSLILRWHFRRFGSTLSNREAFSRIFPMITLTTILIIAVVKSSLALSLGLVGALSIVRFRTPVKEPEELAYLFVAIAIGIGLGAERTLATVVVVLLILLLVSIVNWASAPTTTKGLFLSIDWEAGKGELAGEKLESLRSIMKSHLEDFDLRRVDTRGDSMEATFFVPKVHHETLSMLVKELEQTLPGAGITFLDQARLPGW